MKKPTIWWLELAAICSLCLTMGAQAAVFNVSNVSGLISAINSANANAEDDTINMTTGTYTLTSVNNTTEGDNGLPVIATKITINGNDSTLQRNAASPAFRLFLVSFNGDLELHDLTISGGKTAAAFANVNGGAILSHGTLSIYNSTLSGNMAVSNGVECHGGAIYAEKPGGTFLRIEDSVLSGNSVSITDFVGSGGAISSLTGAFIARTTISGNTVTSSGSALNGASGGGGAFGFLYMDSCTISGNSAISGSGGLSAAGGLGAANFDIRNSTISGNLARVGTSGDGTGGGLSLYDSGEMTHCTVASNGPGGGIYVQADFFGGGSGFYVDGTILASNTPTNYSNLIGGVDFSQGYNISSDNSAAALFTAPSDMNSVNPFIGLLQDNGGPTYTRALLYGSPAIDSGNPLSFLTMDQRGQARPVDGNWDAIPRVDRGAFEYVPLPNSSKMWSLYE